MMYRKVLCYINTFSQLSLGGYAIDMDVYEDLMQWLWRNSDSSHCLYALLLLNVGARGNNINQVKWAHFGREEEMVTLSVPLTKVSLCSPCTYSHTTNTMSMM